MKPAPGYLLGIDLGTGGAKVALVSTQGRVLGHEVGPVPLHLSSGGGAEQDPHDWTGAIGDAIRGLLARGLAPTDEILAVSVTAQWMGTVAVDAGGRPLGNAIIWMDARGAPQARRVAGGGVEVPGTGYKARTLPRWLRLTGGLPLRTGKDCAGHILWLQAERPEHYAAATTFLDVPDYLNLWLTGRACASFDTVVGLWCPDNRDLHDVRYDDALVARLGIDRAKLPDLVPTGSVIGTVRAEVADDLGLPAGVAVTTATGDTSSAGIGAGAVRDFDAHLYIGTSSWVSCHVPFRRTHLRTGVTSLPSGIPRRYWVASEQDVAGKALDWLVAMLDPGDAADRHTEPARSPHERLNDLAASAPAGSGGVLFAPWLNGEQTPVGDQTLRGMWCNLGLATTQAELVRAVFEGVALNTRWMLDAVERFVRRERPDGFASLAFVGGGARSDLWCRILADVLDRPVHQIAEPLLANARGAALAGAVTLGHLAWDDIPALVDVAAVYEPDPAHRAVYDARFVTFVELHRRTRRLFARLDRQPHTPPEGPRP